MRFEKWKLNNLKPAEYNPRKTLQPGDPEYQKILCSIQKFGYVDPVIINQDGTIIGGRQRYTVLQDMGYDEVEVVVVDLNKQDEKALNIALNKISGEWDPEKLKELLQELNLGEFDITVTGFDLGDLEKLIEDLEIEPAAFEDNFDSDRSYEEIEDPVSRRGDIWILGRHRLMCGDATSAEDLEFLMDGKEAQLVITDPPYNVNYGDKVEFLDKFRESNVSRDNSQIKNDCMSDLEFYQFLLDAFRNLHGCMKLGAAIYVFHADSKGLEFRQAYQDAGLKLAQCLIWEKNAFVLGRQDYQWRHEPCLYGWKEGAAHYFVDDRTQDTILFENRPMKSLLHPTMKPVELFGRLISNSSKTGWNVLDVFGGSGTTLIAAEQLQRTAYLMELDERSCDVIVRRWEELTGLKATHQAGRKD